MTYEATKFEVARYNGLGGGAFTRNVTGVQMDRLYKINIHFFSNEKGGVYIILFSISSLALSYR